MNRVKALNGFQLDHNNSLDDQIYTQSAVKRHALIREFGAVLDSKRKPAAASSPPTLLLKIEHHRLKNSAHFSTSAACGPFAPA